MKTHPQSNKKGVIKGTNFRWVVPQLPSEIWNDKQKFKTDLLDRLMASKTARKGIKYYSIAIESHADGNPHLDCLLIFEKVVELRPTELDFLCEKHGDLTRYRNLNLAILEYGSKEDTPLTNLKTPSDLLVEQALKTNPEVFLMKKIDEQPCTFNFIQYCGVNKHFDKIKRWSYIKNKMKDYQEYAANALLKAKPGIKLITPDFIKKTLTPEEYEIFSSWSGYCTIISFINELNLYKCNRPFKSKQLLLVGAPNTGKTTLVRQLSKYYATYQIGVSNWFPKFQSNVYPLLSWNEFSLNTMPYPNLLKLLEGTPMDLQYKGGSTLKSDNPLVIASSNLPYLDHLIKKFGSYSKQKELYAAVQNFPARVTQLKIPKEHKLFFLLKLLVSN